MQQAAVQCHHSVQREGSKLTIEHWQTRNVHVYVCHNVSICMHVGEGEENHYMCTRIKYTARLCEFLDMGKKRMPREVGRNYLSWQE